MKMPVPSLDQVKDLPFATDAVFELLRGTVLKGNAPLPLQNAHSLPFSDIEGAPDKQ